MCVEGVIGVGKTTIALKLAQEWGAVTLLEEALENPYLERFYEDPETFAFPAQLHFLSSRFKELSRLKQTSLFDRVAVADYTFQKDWVFASINLSDSDFKVYEKMYAEMLPQVPLPDLVILLQARVESLMRRIASASRIMPASSPASISRTLPRLTTASSLPIIRGRCWWSTPTTWIFRITLPISAGCLPRSRPPAREDGS